MTATLASLANGVARWGSRRSSALGASSLNELFAAAHNSQPLLERTVR